jgi:glycerophosphoryl diester phosphodiesterase
MNRPLVVAHRGASGYLPEHTLPAYLAAIDMGADFIEPDLVATRDGVLVARHENEISGTTDVAEHPEFAARRRRQSIDGVEVEGWFTEDFTLAELRTLRARERLPELRRANVRWDGQFPVPTFNEVLAFVAVINETRRRRKQAPVGVYPETKHPSHFQALGLALEPLLVAELRAGLADTPVFIQSFETANLKSLRRQCDYPLVQLVDESGVPWDRQQAGDRRDVRQMLGAEGLREIAAYADAVGPYKHHVIPWAPGGDRLGKPTSLVEDAHRAGLKVHCWTFRVENSFLPTSLRRGERPEARGNAEAELSAYVEAGIDGYFTDQPDLRPY